MKTSQTMQEIITQIAAKHGLDLTTFEAHLRLDLPGFDRLVIEKIAQHQVSVAHYYDHMGDLIADPEIVFFTGYGEWVPIEVTHSLGGHRIYAQLAVDGQAISRLAVREQANLAGFAEMWAKNIKAQGWLEHGQKWDPCDPALYEQPDLETLIEWEAEGFCEAVDGCIVESDGTCPHGCQSWARQ